MRRRIVWVAIVASLALIVIGAGAALAWPATRHMISGLWNVPDRLPALPGNSQVHYQLGAQDFARDVAPLLPDAIMRVEAVHGRRFAHPATVGVYATPEAYAAANGLGSDVPAGVTFFGRVNLSPKLFWKQHQRLPAILTHELSHAHIQGWIGETAYVLRLPNWFKEGLAVMVSEGGGAELVSEEEARAAIERGEQITIDDAGSLQPVWHSIRKNTCKDNLLVSSRAGLPASRNVCEVPSRVRSAGVCPHDEHDSRRPHIRGSRDGRLPR